MARIKTTSSNGSSRKIRPALTPEARENQMIALAMDLVEQRLIDGTASSQETTHFLKLATEKTKLENARMAKQIELDDAKIKHIEAEENKDQLFKEAIDAMRMYSGNGSVPNDDEEDY